MKRRRCAIYTRKSTQEGLDQSFNSLDAQREACEAYITSQAGVGWVKVKDPYDDGGFSGGTMQRPGLQALLCDIEAGKVQIIVTYKVDRLTRSLSDFARMIELFDRHSVSFVSVTQQFNTTTSMGRLTLNVLLSFAQFEREVTAERIRDKIAASKRKGLWMGGVVPLGYDAVDKKLIVNLEEAATVRSLYRLYQEKGNVAAVEQEAIRLGLRTKARTPNNAKRKGGEPFTRGHIYKILSNPLYIGEVTHKGSRYPGEHQPIVDRDIWQAVQSQLKENAVKRHVPANSKSTSLLKGLLYDGEGRQMKPAHANKKGPALSLLHHPPERAGVIRAIGRLAPAGRHPGRDDPKRARRLPWRCAPLDPSFGHHGRAGGTAAKAASQSRRPKESTARDRICGAAEPLCSFGGAHRPRAGANPCRALPSRYWNGPSRWRGCGRDTERREPDL